MWHINILNQRVYEETGEYLVVMFRIGDCFYAVMDQLETNDIRDLKIVSYELPFPLKGNNHETLYNLQEKIALLLKLDEMEGTQYGLRFKQLCDHFYSGDIEKYINNHEQIKWLNIANYNQLLSALIKADYISYGFVCRFFDFKRFFEANKNYDKEFVKSLNADFLSLICARVVNADYREYLKIDEVAAYLKNVLNVLETEVGFFVDEHYLYLLENCNGDREIYAMQLLEQMKVEKWFDDVSEEKGI